MQKSGSGILLFGIGLGIVIAVLAGLAVSQTSPDSAPPQAGQAKPSTAVGQSVTTIRSESRLVVLDVVVTGKHREPVLGLGKDDFLVLDNGKPQTITFFEAHQPSNKKPELLPPNQYTNVTAETPSSLDIVLFDLLNTDHFDQPYAREEMIQFLKTLPSGRLVSLFELEGQLHMIAGFTTNSDDLVLAARRVVPRRSTLLDTYDARQEELNQLNIAREGSMNQEFFDRMSEFMGEMFAARDENRAQLTLQALGQLARAVSGFRGRKNIIWLSEEFPVYFGPNLDPDNRGTSPIARNYSNIMRDLAGELSNSQISLYPIDVRGLLSLRPSASLGGPAPGGDRIWQLESMHVEMDNLAKQTGGRAYYNTNDLRGAMRNSFENGSNYYTLAYVPPNEKLDSKYHRFKVEMKHSGMEPEYRQGYFATPAAQVSDQEAVDRLRTAVGPAAPESTMLHLKAQLSLPDAEHKKVRFDLVLDGSGLEFADGPESRKKTTLRFIAVAWDKDLKPAYNQVHTIELSLPPEKFEHAVHNGIAAHQEMQLPPGTYRVRLGVMDDRTQKIGTIEIPVRIAEDANPKPTRK